MKSFEKLEKNKQRLLVWDETLRDGEQTPGVMFSIQEKLSLARAIDRLGTDIIDVGFPLVSKDEFEAVKNIAYKKDEFSADLGITLRATCEDINAVEKLPIDNLFLFSPTSDIHIDYKLRSNRKMVLDNVLRAVDLCNKKKKEVVFITEDTTRTDPSFLFLLLEKLYHEGVNKIILTDTVGIAEPMSFCEQLREIIQQAPSQMIFGIHCHNDLGLAVANTVMAIQAGARFITVTMNGIGERAGNAALDEVVMIAELLLNQKTNIEKKRLQDVAKLVEQLSGVPIPFLKPIVGFNAFRHESGIHVDGLIKKPLTYEAIDPKLVGRERKFVYGKHSGSKMLKTLNVQRRAQERLQDLFQSYSGSVQGDKKDFIGKYRSYLAECFGWDSGKVTQILACEGAVV